MPSDQTGPSDRAPLLGTPASQGPPVSSPARHELPAEPAHEHERDPYTMVRTYQAGAASGTSALVAQLSALTFLALVAWAIFTHLPHPLPLFGWHPLTQSFALVLLAQALLTLQPTTGAQPSRKARASTLHQFLLALAVVPLFTAGASIMYHLHDQPGTQHYISWHGTLGATLVPIAWLQAAAGAAATWGNGILVGGPAKGRALWKYHRYATRLVPLVSLPLPSPSSDVRTFCPCLGWKGSSCASC